ncbi:MAG: tRNA (N6-threonylcarbamoyladenosine(37)-N6)-methyltransferase TrmO [Rhizobiaceae bacterium]|nr:tRNA (N6-threonylcarbamoyladenosine(37)-N6)-methyltransferase TrmO [Rhizobiaceae bacterium]
MSLVGQKMTRQASSHPLFPPREGEVALPFDPASADGDARIVFIGRIRSPWKSRDDCPKNMAAAHDAGGGGTVEINTPYRAGLIGLVGTSHLILLSWLQHSPRNLILQKPRHATEPKGVFALRSPARPNPVGVHVVRLTRLDAEAGRLGLEAIDVLDGTPLIDVKPYFASTDAVPEATRDR